MALKLAEKALEIAMLQIGRGETEANNKGPWVREYRRDEKAEAWCAAFISWCYELAWARINGFEKWAELPKDLKKRCPLKRSHGAKRLYKSLTKVPDGYKPEIGDIACWHRGAKGAATGHVGLVSAVKDDGVFFCVEGNRGAFPSKVAEFKHVLGEGGLIGFARVLLPSAGE